MTSQEMFKTKLKPGYWYVNVAAIGQEQYWQAQVMPLPDDGKLFGYNVKEFLAKQYK